MSHSIFLQRVRQLGVEGTALNWLTSYLTDNSSPPSPVTPPPSPLLCRRSPRAQSLAPCSPSATYCPLVTSSAKSPWTSIATPTIPRSTVHQHKIHSEPTPHPHQNLHIHPKNLAHPQHNFLKLISDKTEHLLIGTKSTLIKTGPITPSTT